MFHFLLLGSPLSEGRFKTDPLFIYRTAPAEAGWTELRGRHRVCGGLFKKILQKLSDG